MKRARNEILLLAGDGLSAFGTWIDFLAILTLAAYQFHVSSYQMALVSAAGLLPGMLLSPLIGRLCDRGNPKQILLASIVLRVGATGAIIFCHDYFVFLALVSLRSVFAMVAPPAINVLAVRSVEASYRPRFYALLNVLNNSAKVLAPAIGTVSSSLASESLALGMSVVFSMASLLVFAFIHLGPGEAKTATAGRAQDKPATASPDLLPLLWVAATCAFFIFMVNNLVPLVLQRAGFDKALLGLLISCSGAGSILSGLWLAKKSASTALQGDINELIVPATLQASGFGAIGLILWLTPGHAEIFLPLLFFVIGTFSARYAIAMNVHVAAHFAGEIGHVWGVLQAWQNAMILVAPMIGSVVLDAMGAAWLFAFATGSAALSFALFYLLRMTGSLRPPASVSALPVPSKP
jgi:predicted MFS family arabinose efflux permease